MKKIRRYYTLKSSLFLVVGWYSEQAGSFTADTEAPISRDSVDGG